MKKEREPNAKLATKAPFIWCWYPRQPPPQVALAEVSFSLFLRKIQPTFTLGSRTRLGGRDN